MTNQPTPVIDVVQDRHIEKVILSGSPFVSAILGSGAYLVATNGIPVFYTSPSISGSLIVFSELSCNGDSYNSSPRGITTYQWKKDTVNIPNAINKTYITVLGDVGAIITCEVTITNILGFVIGLTGGVIIQGILESSVYELDFMPITGMGMTPTTSETNTLDIHLINGMLLDAAETVTTTEVVALTGMSNDAIATVLEIDAYAMIFPTALDPLIVVNGDAENSAMTDWTMDTGTVTSVTSATGSATTGREGLRFFMPADLGQGVDSQMSQVIIIPAGDLTDIDTGLCYCYADFIHMSDEGFDKIVITLEALNAADTVLATMVYSPPAGPTASWLQDSTVDDLLFLPTLTRKVKLTVLFDAHVTSGTAANSAYADAFAIPLMKTQ